MIRREAAINCSAANWRARLAKIFEFGVAWFNSCHFWVTE